MARSIFSQFMKWRRSVICRNLSERYILRVKLRVQSSEHTYKFGSTSCCWELRPRNCPCFSIGRGFPLTLLGGCAFCLVNSAGVRFSSLCSSLTVFCLRCEHFVIFFVGAFCVVLSDGAALNVAMVVFTLSDQLGCFRRRECFLRRPFAHVDTVPSCCAS